MNITTLKYFITLAETLNFTNAAQIHYISQTTMSRQISNLEKDLGIRLFERDTNHVSLTKSGKIFLSDIQEVIAAYDKAVNNVTNAGNPVYTLKLGYCNGFEGEDFLNMIDAYIQQHPNVKFDITESSPSQLVKKVCSHVIDMIFIFDCEIKNYNNINSVNLIDHDVLIGVGKNHPLSSFDRIDPKLLAPYEVLIINDKISTNHRQYIIDCCINDGFIPNIKEISSFKEQFLAARYSDAVAFFSDTSVINTYRDKLKFIKLIKSSHRYRINIAWHKANSNPAVSEFISFAKTYFNELK